MNNRSSMRRLLLFFAFGCWGTLASVQAQVVSKTFEEKPLKTVLKEIEKQSGLSIIYSVKEVDENKLVSGNFKNAQVLDVLKKILDPSLDVQLQNKMIVIKKKNQTSQKSAKTTTIKGNVMDNTGFPVIGASVVVKGTTNGQITDIDGNYTLNDVPEDATISISYIGFKTIELPANSKELAHISLSEDSEVLEEVVVVGYGSQKKANLTGAVATISSKEINERPVSTAAGALQGADPSVNLSFNTGSLDSEYKIDIRGVASVNGGSPLILADGMEVSLNQINPNDIESISVLKDASASAIYGAKASSGVVLITTKRGKDMGGKAVVQYNGRIGWKQNTTSTDYIHTGYDHVNIVNTFYEAYQGKLMANYKDEDLQMLYDRRNDKSENPDRPWRVTGDDGKYYYYANFDWYDYFFRKTRPENEHNVSFTGGNDKVDYFVSGRYMSQDGIFKIYEDNYKNYSFRAKVNAKLNKWMRYTGNVNFNSTGYNYAGYKDEQQTIHSLQSNILSSFMPVNVDGSVVQYVNQLTANSPLGAGHAGFLTANEARNTRANKYWVMSHEFNFDITNDIVLTASYAYKSRNRLHKYRSMPFDYSRQEGKTQTFTSGTITDYYQEDRYEVENHNVNVFGTFEKTFQKRHNVKFVAGTQFEDYHSSKTSVRKNDLLSKDLDSFSVATGEATIGQDLTAFRTLGFFGRLNYDFEGKYLFEASGRWDGTSRFSADDRWGFFPSASAGWRISQEDFFEPLQKFVNNAKIRFSVGSLGNQQVDDYAYFDEIITDNQMDDYTFDGLNKAYYASVTSPKTSKLTWETVTTYDVGLDLSFLDSRLTVTADYYVRKTKDMLTPSLTLPSVFGAKTPLANCADLRTNGWELYVGWNDGFNLNGKRFSYNVAATVGDYKSTITKYNNPDKLISDYYEGMQLGEIWGYKVAGLFASDEEAAAYQAKINDKNVNGRVYSSKKDKYLRAGDVKFIDLDGNNVISEGAGTVADPGDKRIIGNMLPRYSYTLRAGANWNNIDFSIFFQGVGKQDWYPTTYAYNFWGPYSFPSLSFIHKDFMDNCWSEDNPGGYFPRQRGYQSYSSGALGVKNDRYLQNAAYLRLKNLTIGYTLPVLKNVFSKVRIYASGENLFYWSPMKKYTKTIDPELTNTGSTYNSGSGVGYGYSRTFSLGVDVTF